MEEYATKPTIAVWEVTHRVQAKRKLVWRLREELFVLARGLRSIAFGLYIRLSWHTSFEINGAPRSRTALYGVVRRRLQHDADDVQR